MKKNRFKHCLLILLVLAFSSSVAAQDQQFTVEQLKAKANEAFDKDDYKEAAMWFRMAAEKGDLSSQEFLSTLLEHGDEKSGLEKNEDEALMWLTKAAEAGSTSAQMTLARKYKEGNGVVKNAQEAIKWYRMAAEKGNTDAMNRLGLLHDNKKEYQEAIKWYRMAAEKGNGPAMYDLGKMYYLRGLTKRGLPDDKKELNGEVVDFDKDDGLNSFAEAQKWFNKTIETYDRISEDATTDPIGKAAAGMMKGNAEMYLEIVKKAIDRGK